MNPRLKRVGPIVALGVALALSAVVATTANAGPQKKTYTASSSPSRLEPASRQTVQIRLTNTSRNDLSFGAANLIVPAGLAVDLSVPPTLSPAIGTAAVSDGVLELRNLAVGTSPPANTVTVTFTLGAVAPTCQSYEWLSDVRQSNDFNGTQNIFTLSGPAATMQGPCSAANVTCTAGDESACTTGTISSPGGGIAEVVVQDADALSGTLTAALSTDAFQCDEYVASSDQLSFGITITNGVSTLDMIKQIQFSQAIVDTRDAWEYQACFKAPYDFPALLPSQLAHDFATGDFTGNTQTIGTDHKGLLLPCSAGYGPPCIDGRAIEAGRIVLTVDAPVADPAVRF